MNEKIYQIALSLLNGIGPKKAKTLVSYVGSAQGVFEEKTKYLAKIPGIGLQLLRSVDMAQCLERAIQEYDFIQKNDLQVHYYQDLTYPQNLLQCDDGPIVLYAKGNPEFDEYRNIAVVGTRKATAYGKEMTQQLIEELKEYNVRVVSGLAYGIDIATHKSSIENMIPTIGVLAHGLDDLYPVAHKSVAKEMVAQKGGGLVSEFLSRTNADPGNFPKRNRIVAGMCDAAVVIESSYKGGSLITAGLANDYHRDVFAFPGNVNKLSSVGCNYLIQKNRAHLITSAKDMIEILGWEEKNHTIPIQTDLFTGYSHHETLILNVLKEKGVSQIDDLCHAVSLPVSQLSVQLFNLEMKGAIRSLSGKRFEFI